MAGSLDDNGLLLSIDPDPRGKAGFAPALVLNVSVPNGQSSAHFAGVVQASSPTGIQRALQVQRAEYWLMGTFPRTPTAITEVNALAPIDKSGKTLYKLYFQVPKELVGEFTLQVPPIAWLGGEVALPPVRFAVKGDDLELCPP